MYSIDVSLNKIIEFEENEIDCSRSKIYKPHEIDNSKYKFLKGSDYIDLDNQHPLKNNCKQIYLQVDDKQNALLVMYLYKSERVDIQADLDIEKITRYFGSEEELDKNRYLNDFNRIRDLVLKGIISKDFLIDFRDGMFLELKVVINL